MIVLTELEVYNYIFTINHTKNKFVLYTNTFEEFSLKS